MRTCGWCLELSVFFLASFVFYLVLPFSFQPFLMFTSVPNERSMSNPLCYSSLGSVVTSDYVTPLTASLRQYNTQEESNDHSYPLDKHPSNVPAQDKPADQKKQPKKPLLLTPGNQPCQRRQRGHVERSRDMREANSGSSLTCTLLTTFYLFPSDGKR